MTGETGRSSFKSIVSLLHEADGTSFIVSCTKERPGCAIAPDVARALACATGAWQVGVETTATLRGELSARMVAEIT
jgi:hypothetical protein